MASSSDESSRGHRQGSWQSLSSDHESEQDSEGSTSRGERPEDVKLTRRIVQSQQSSENPQQASSHYPSKAEFPTANPTPTRKRPARPSLTGEVHRPRKRAKGVLNRDYLDLLNVDIEDAAFCYVPHQDSPMNGKSGLSASQIGLTYWTVEEKELFFEALGRLGRDDVPGIARRVQSKGELEIQQYLKILHDALKSRQQNNELRPLELADYPAAVELSEDCCQALEEAGDALSVRQEAYEKAVEHRRWGDIWLITRANYEEVEVEALAMENPHVEPTGLFHVDSWLTLSERIFMNSPDEDGNWSTVGEELPSIRATALDDFHSLVVSVTKRLVTASLYMAMSRIRSKRAADPRVQDLVKPKDVQAAAASLGFKSESKSYWVRCARRLGLEVYHVPPKPSHVDTEPPLAYDEVEDILSAGLRESYRQKESNVHDLSSSDNGDSASAFSSDHESSPRSMTEESEDPTKSDSQDEDVAADLDEVLLYSAVDHPQTTSDKRRLVRRIKAERDQERYADALDAEATYREERRMWKLLGSKSESILKPDRLDGDRRRKVSVADVYNVGKDWRSKLHYVSEWEVMSGLQRNSTP